MADSINIQIIFGNIGIFKLEQETHLEQWGSMGTCQLEMVIQRIGAKHVCQDVLVTMIIIAAQHRTVNYAVMMVKKLDVLVLN